MKIKATYDLPSAIASEHTKAASKGAWHSLQRTIIIQKDNKIVVATANIIERFFYNVCNLFKFNYLKKKLAG